MGRQSQTFVVDDKARWLRDGGVPQSITVSTRTARTETRSFDENQQRSRTAELIPVRFWMIQACKQLRADDAK
jgi:hypothetical protein